jgi:hypothetical protein
MLQPARPHHIHRPGLRPPIQGSPIDALMWRRKIPKRDGLDVAPSHGDDGDVGVAHDGLAKGIETMVFCVWCGISQV